jgi:hypothetical protein
MRSGAWCSYGVKAKLGNGLIKGGAPVVCAGICA